MIYFKLAVSLFLLTVTVSGNCSNVTIANQAFNSPVSYTTYDTVVIRNCTFANIAGNGLTCFNSKYLLIDSCSFHNITGYALYVRSAEYTVIENSSFDSIGSGLIFGFESQDNFTHSADNAAYRNDSLFIRDNVIRNIQNNAVKVNNTSFLDFDHNLIDSCLYGGIVLGSGAGIANCSLVDELNTIGIAIRSETRMNSCYIRNNTILHTLCDGIRTSENVYNSQILNNEIAFVAYDGIGARPVNGDHGMYLQGPDVLVEGNNVHDILDSCGGAGCDGVGISIRTTGRITKNIIHGCINSGIAYFNDHPGGTKDFYITNNLVYDNTRTAIYVATGCPESVPDSIHIYHNTVISQPVQALWHHACPLGFYDYAGYKDVIGNILIYEGVADSTHFIFNNTGVVNALYNIKDSSDAGFVNFAARDLRLSASSAAVDEVPLPYIMVPDDILGRLRIPPADAGAYEYYPPVTVRDTTSSLHDFAHADTSQVHDTITVNNIAGIPDTLVVSSVTITCDTVSNTSAMTIDSAVNATFDTVFVSYTFSQFDSTFIHCIASTTDSVFIPETVSGLNSITADDAWAVYPNATNGKIVITQSGNEFATAAMLYDVSGKRILSILLTGAYTTADLSAVTQAGVYFLKLKSEHYCEPRKIVILKP